MSERIELELDTPSELLLKAMARLGWAGCLVLGAIWAAQPHRSLAAPLALTTFLAFTLSLLAWALSEFYVLDLTRRRLVYLSRLFAHQREQSFPFDELLASSLVTTASRGLRGGQVHHLSAPCLVTRAGQVLRVGDFELKPGDARARARQLAEQIGCRFHDPGPGRSLLVRPTGSVVDLGDVPARPSLGERVYLAWTLSLFVWFGWLLLVLSRAGN